MRRFVNCLILYVTAVMILGSVPGQEMATTHGALIVLNKSNASATLISLKSGKTVATIPTGNGPHEVAVSPDGKTAVVTNYGTQQQPGSSVTIIDLQQRKAIKTIDLKKTHEEKYERPHGVVFLPDGERVLVTAESQKALLTVDINAGKVIQAVDTKQEVSHMVALTPQAHRAFVANIRSGSVSVIDLKKAEMVTIIETGAGAEGLDIAPDGRELWVSNRAEDSISIINTETLQVVKTLACKTFPIRVKFTPDGKYVLVSNARSGDVAVFDARGREEVRRIPMQIQVVRDKEGRLFSDRFGESPVPVGILIHPSGRSAYVANTNADMVAVIDLNTWQITNYLKAGREPDGLGFSGLE